MIAAAVAPGASGLAYSAPFPATSGSAPRLEHTSAAPCAIASSADRPNGSGQRLGTTAMAARLMRAIVSVCGR